MKVALREGQMVLHWQQGRLSIAWGAIDIAIESVWWLLKYSSSIGLGCDASILAVLHVRIGVAQGGGPGLAVAEENEMVI